MCANHQGKFFSLLDILYVDIIALSVTYEYPVLCDIIDMHDLEKAAGSYHSCCGLVYLLFVPLSGMNTFQWLIKSLPNLAVVALLLGSIIVVQTTSLRIPLYTVSAHYNVNYFVVYQQSIYLHVPGPFIKSKAFSLF